MPVIPTRVKPRKDSKALEARLLLRRPIFYCGQLIFGPGGLQSVHCLIRHILGIFSTQKNR